jgi:hypothetical protein
LETQGKKHVLVLGCGRSGTSIFGELFEDTGHFIYKSEVDMDEIMSLSTDLPLALKVPRPSEKYPADQGLSFPLETLLEKLEHNVKIFWIVRHPLDTICSLKVGISKNWGHHPRPLDWMDWLEKPLLEQCAHHWNYINSHSFACVKEIAEVVYFEDMIRHPRKFAQAALDKVDIQEVKIDSWCLRVQNRNNSDFIEARTSRAYSTNDHSKRVVRWRENMTTEEAVQVWPMVSNLAEKFAYEK